MVIEWGMSKGRMRRLPFEEKHPGAHHEGHAKTYRIIDSQTRRESNVNIPRRVITGPQLVLKTQRRERRRQPHDREEVRFGDFKFHIKISKFIGTLQADKFIDQLNKVKRIFKYKEVPEQTQVKLITIKLKGQASTWWERLKKMQERQGKMKINDQDKMKKKMREQFLLFSYSQTLYQRLHTLRK